MIYGGIDLSRLMVCSCARPLMASPEVETQKRPGACGFDVASVQLVSIEIEMKCVVFAKDSSGLSMRDRERSIAAALFGQEKRPLVWPDDPDYYCMAIVKDVSAPKRRIGGDAFTVTFLCDPVLYSAEKSVPLTSGANAVHVGGTMPTRPIIEVTAESSVGSVTLTNLGTAELVKVVGSFSKGSKLVVDMGLRRATVNGANAAVTLQSDFFELSPGKNSVKLSSGSGALKYREVWL